MWTEEIKEHLSKDLIPFWEKLRDDIYGGFYGEMNYDLERKKKADKGCILNSRILWFFSNAYFTLKDEACLSNATHAYEFLKRAFYDREYGGVYWSVTYDGKPVDTTKHTYCQAFAVYGLASYYDASGNREALHMAYMLIDRMETVCLDEIGYLEAFERDFKPASNEKLSENGVIASRTMNTLLHVFEAYTEVYRVDKKENIADCMRRILDVFADRVYNPKEKRLEVFFDASMNSLINLNSYGHDIEASWLIDRGLMILGDETYKNKITPITTALAERTYATALDGSSLFYEWEDGRLDTKKVWWVQAEAVLGFLNAYRKDGTKKEYLETAVRIWEFIKTNFIDSREGSEWLNELYHDGSPVTSKEIVGPWKCPYHNGRMCLEIFNDKL